MWSWFIFCMARQICQGAEQSVLCSVPRSATRCGTDGLKQLKVNWVQWKWISFKILWPIFFFTGLWGNTLSAAIINSLVSVCVHFIATTASYVFVKYLKLCQKKPPFIFSRSYIFLLSAQLKYKRVLVQAWRLGWIYQMQCILMSVHNEQSHFNRGFKDWI